MNNREVTAVFHSIQKQQDEDRLDSDRRLHDARETWNKLPLGIRTLQSHDCGVTVPYYSHGTTVLSYRYKDTEDEDRDALASQAVATLLACGVHFTDDYVFVRHNPSYNLGNEYNYEDKSESAEVWERIGQLDNSVSKVQLRVVGFSRPTGYELRVERQYNSSEGWDRYEQRCDFR